MALRRSPAAPLAALVAVAALALSAACHRARPAAGDVTSSIVVGERTRTFVLHAPAALDPAKKPWPLVIALHGRGGDGASMEKLSHFSELADKEGFLVAYPDGVGRSWNDGRPGSHAEKEGVDDVKFLSSLIDDLVAGHGADPKRVFVTGMSNGAMMSHRFACDLPDKVAAIGPVAGLMSATLAAACAPKRPVPAILFYGTDDPIMPYGGGRVGSDVGGEVLSADETRKKWASLDGCTDSPAPVDEPDTDPSDGTRSRRTAHAACKDGSEVVLHSVEHGGHTWPGGYQYLNQHLIGKTSRDIDATALMWAFFSRHPMR
jgi:polyhydroxybutyrate depolymerase